MSVEEYSEFSQVREGARLGICAFWRLTAANLRRVLPMRGPDKRPRPTTTTAKHAVLGLRFVTKLAGDRLIELIESANSAQHAI